jgi:hypothetical protein
MARQSSIPSGSNNVRKTGAIKTPAPDAVTHIRNPQGEGYGTNGPQPSSIPSGSRVLSSLGANLESSVDDGGVLAHVIQQGHKIPGDFQTRKVNDEMLPLAHGMRRRSGE